jgi:hypothetical protein
MSVEGKREGEASNFRGRSVSANGIRWRHLTFGCFGDVVQPTDMLTNLAKNGPRNVSIWPLRKIDFSEILICRQPSGQR